MSIVASPEPRIRDVKVTGHTITAHLVDGRVISVPLAWSWRLCEATPAQRANFEIIGDGYGVHWPDVDEDISAEGMLHGVPAYRPPKVSGLPKPVGHPRHKPPTKHGQAADELPRTRSGRRREKRTASAAGRIR